MEGEGGEREESQVGEVEESKEEHVSHVLDILGLGARAGQRHEPEYRAEGAIMHCEETPCQGNWSIPRGSSSASQHGLRKAGTGAVHASSGEGCHGVDGVPGYHAEGCHGVRPVPIYAGASRGVS